ncbi:MAG TPA: hypothetical protein VM124_00330 [Candidatus Limnocylindrales bacterium]|nr:hypothetical protein [Candidatus Limnocylindrales bacterium]
MARVYREVRETSVADPDTAAPVVVQRGANLAARIVSLIGGIIVAFLGLRFILSLLGANRDNAFASFVYGISHPFVAPFFGLFNYREQIGVVRFEFETLIAIAFWSFVTWMIVRLLSLGDRNHVV